MVLEKILESPLDCKEIRWTAVHPKGNQSWIFTGRTDAKAETAILWPPDVKNWLIGKYLDAGKDWRQEEKGQQRMRWLDVITNSMDMSLSKLQALLRDRAVWHKVVHGSQRAEHDNCWAKTRDYFWLITPQLKDKTALTTAVSKRDQQFSWSYLFFQNTWWYSYPYFPEMWLWDIISNKKNAL